MKCFSQINYGALYVAQSPNDMVDALSKTYKPFIYKYCKLCKLLSYRVTPEWDNYCWGSERSGVQHGYGWKVAPGENHFRLP